jgi:hypothetical protein
MKDVLVVVSSNHGIEPETRMCIDKLRDEGVSYIEQQGTSDVAMARNIALTLACVELLKYESLKTVLMIDDDMYFTTEDAKKVVEESQKGYPVSGVTVTKSSVFPHKPISKTRWAGGLFFLAIPRKDLLDLHERSKTIDIRDGNGNWSCKVFTWTGADERQWVGEDRRLSMRLGGVVLTSVRIGHLKKQAMYFGDEGQEDKIQAFIMNALEKFNG